MLLDDPLNALDQEVGWAVFEECFDGWLCINNCALIIVTHQLQYLPQCDSIIVMGRQGIEKYGTFSQLISIMHHYNDTL